MTTNHPLTDEALAEARARHKRKEISGGELKRLVLSSCDLPKLGVWETFGAELLLVRDEELRNYTAGIIDRLPNYFWHVPASIMGFHAIASDNAVGGLVRHTQKVARMAATMGEPWSLDHLSDSMVATAFLHDGLKYGWDGTVPREGDHASFCARWLKREGLFEDHPQIVGMVGAHHGKWGKWRPRTEAEWAFHLADYVVSRGAVPHLNGHDRT